MKLQGLSITDWISDNRVWNAGLLHTYPGISSPEPSSVSTSSATDVFCSQSTIWKWY